MINSPIHHNLKEIKMDILFATKTLREAAIQTFFLNRMQLGIALITNEKDASDLSQSRMYGISKSEGKYIVRYAEMFDGLSMDESLNLALPFFLLSGVAEWVIHVRNTDGNSIAVLYSKNGPFYGFTATFEQCKKMANLHVTVTDNSLEFNSIEEPKATDPKEGLWSLEDMRKNPNATPLRIAFRSAIKTLKSDMENTLSESLMRHQIVGEA